MQNTGLKRTFSDVLAAVMLIFCALPLATAAQECSLTVCIYDTYGEPVSDVSVCIAAVAYADDSGGYTMADGFADSEISALAMPPGTIGAGTETPAPESGSTESDAERAQEFYWYLLENGVEYTAEKTGAAGTAFFGSLKEGIYLVFCGDDGEVSFDPYLVTLLETEGGVTVYDVESVPKTVDIKSVTGNVSISVTKVWYDDMDYYGARPDSIAVVLYLNETPYKRTELNDGNGWAYTFENLPDGGEYAYTINEVTVDNYVSMEFPTNDGFLLWNIYDGPIPTETPTAEPTDAPTEEPTEPPTAAPTEEPTDAPTPEPTAAPSTDAPVNPTEAPTTSAPSETPAPTSGTENTPIPSSAAETPAPTTVPERTSEPTVEPTASPTSAPEPIEYHLSVKKGMG